MRKLRLAVALILSSLFLFGVAGDALALRDPFIVCVTEPCGPQLPLP